MKIKIVIPELLDKIENISDFQYVLGYLRLKEGKTEISFFSNKFCMIFLSIAELLIIIQETSKNKNTKIRWVGEDNGYSFSVSQDEKNIIFEGNDYNFKFNLKKFNKALQKSIKKITKFVLKINPEIQIKDYFNIEKA